MSEMHRRALGGTKTVSRKARSRQPSVPTSRTPSHAGSHHVSRAASRAGSEDEEDNMSDDTNFSVNSVDELLLPDDLDAPPPPASWAEDLHGCVEALQDRNWKRSNTETREHTLTYYSRILTLKYARDAIQNRETELVAAFLKSVKTASSDKEVVLALRALDLTTLTLQPDAIYEDAAPALKRAITDAESIAVKTAAIYALAVTTFFGDVADDETIANLNFLLEIVSSDGGFIDAADAPSPVIAALESYGFLATLVDDLAAESHDAIEVFLDQLRSAHAAVAIAAGENIALLYEKAAGPGPGDSGDEQSDSDSNGSGSGSGDGGGAVAPRYDAYRRTDQLEAALAQLAHVSSRARSKKDRRSLHTHFADILNSVQNPGHGPRYRTALRADTGAAYGSRMIVRLHAHAAMRIDRWWKLARLQGLRRVLRDGFLAHWEANPVIFEALPVILLDRPDPATTLAASKLRSKHFAGGTKMLAVP